MNTTINEHNLFRPAKSRSETKADVTNNTARAIIETEAARRAAKTERLRQERLTREAELASVPTPAKPVRKKRTATRSRPSA